MEDTSFGHGSDTASEPRRAASPLITDQWVKKLRPPAKGSRILYDNQIRGFGARVTAASVISFVLNYCVHGRERRYTIGRYPEISALSARAEALRLRAGIRDGHDPLAERFRARTVPTLSDFAQEYLARHAEPYKRRLSVREDKRLLNAIILPRFGRFALDGIGRADLEALRRDLAATPVQANRTMALLHMLFELAIRWEFLPSDFPNPTRGVGRYHEEPRRRWVQGAELVRLLKTLERVKDQEGANALRLMLLTGSRIGETLSARWDQFDLERGTWTKPSHATKQKRTVSIPLSESAIELLANMRRSDGGEYLFPGRDGTHREGVKNLWETIRQEASLEDVRAYDLRHSFASNLVSDGAPLKIVGELLGHTQAHTTERYAHVADQALRRVANQFGKIYEKNRRRQSRPKGSGRN